MGMGNVCVSCVYSKSPCKGKKGAEEAASDGMLKVLKEEKRSRTKEFWKLLKQSSLTLPVLLRDHYYPF